MNTSYFLRIYSVSLNSSFSNSSVADLIFLGIMTGIFRIFGPGAEGVSYAIILGNLLVPLIEKVTMPTPFGKGGKRHGK